jgi:geranyl-CoA carboxylase beta subunit
LDLFARPFHDLVQLVHRQPRKHFLQPRRPSHLGLIDRWRAIEARTRAASERAGPLFAKRGQLLPRERLARLLDAGAPWLELSSMAGYCLDNGLKGN